MGWLSRSLSHEMDGIPPQSPALLTTTHHAEDLTCIPYEGSSAVRRIKETEILLPERDSPLPAAGAMGVLTHFPTDAASWSSVGIFCGSSLAGEGNCRRIWTRT